MEKVSATARASVSGEADRTRATPAPTKSQVVNNLALQALVRGDGVRGLAGYLQTGGSGLPLAAAERDLVEAATGQPLTSARLHRGPVSDAVLATLNARGASAGNHVLIDSRIGGDQFHGVLRHELAHVAQTRGRTPDLAQPLELGAAGSRVETEAERAGAYPSFAFRAPTPVDANVVQLDRCPGTCHSLTPPTKLQWDQKQFDALLKGPSVPIKSPKEILAAQPKTVEAELEGYEQSILATRTTIFDQLEKSRSAPHRTPFGFAPSLPVGILPPDLQQRYRAALVSAAVIQAGIDAPPPNLLSPPGDVSIEAQEEARPAIHAYYLALSEFAEGAGREQVARDERLRAAKEQEALSRAQRPNKPCRTNCHTPNPPPEPSFVPNPPPPSPVPALLAKRLPTNEATLAAAQTVDQWKQVEADLKASVADMDELLFTVLPEFSKEREELHYLKETHAELERLHQEHPSAIPIPAVFYPEDRWVEEKIPGGKGQTVQIPESIPWRFYLYHTSEGSGPAPAYKELAEMLGDWVLVDLTSPKHFVDTYSGAYAPGKDPPYEMFKEKLNHKYRFPKGRLHWLYPSGKPGELETTEPWTVSDWLSAIGLVLAAIALIAGTIVTFGLAAPATVPALVAIGTAAGIASAGFGIASTVTGMHEKERYGLLTEEEKDRAILSIIFDIISALSLGLGQLAQAAEIGAKAAATGARVSTFARTLAALNGRYFFMITRAASVMKKAQLAADVTQLLLTTHDFVVAFSAIRSQQGLSDSDRDKALVKLVSLSLLTGALQMQSVRGGIKDMRGGKLVMSGIDEHGVIDVRATPEADVPHGKFKAPEAPAPRTVESHLDAPLGDVKPGWSRKTTGPQVDPALPEGRVEVRFVRDAATGRIIDAQTFHHAGADAHSIEIHEDIAKLVRTEGEALRSLVHQQRRAFGSEPPPLELQLELKKLYTEMEAAEKKLATGSLTEAQAKDVKDKLNLLDHEIKNAKRAIADPSLRSAYPPDIVALPVKPTVLPKKGPGGEITKPPGMPNPPEGHIYYIRDDGTFDIRPKADYKGAAKFGLEEVDGKPVATNRTHIETAYRDRKITPKRQSELEELGYVFQKNKVVRRPPGHAEAGKPRMVPIEIDAEGRIQIVEGAETLAETQARLRAALPKAQVKKLEGLEALAEEEGLKVALVEGMYDTGVTWKQILTRSKQVELKNVLKANGMADKDIDRLIDGLVNKPGTLKVILGTDPVRAAAPYRELHAELHGSPTGKVEIHHGDPLYLGGGHDPALLFGLKTEPHDALHAFFDNLTLPASSPMGAVRLQPNVIQNKVKGWGLAKPAAAIVDPVSGAVQFQVLGK